MNLNLIIFVIILMIVILVFLQNFSTCPKKYIKQNNIYPTKQNNIYPTKQNNIYPTKQNKKNIIYPIKQTNIYPTKEQEFNIDIISNLDKNKKITLYYAKWCSHCHPVKAFFNELIKTNTNTISYNMIESDEFKNIPNIYNKISGYPTIIIEYNGQEIKYSGSRSKDALVDFVNKL